MVSRAVWPGLVIEILGRRDVDATPGHPGVVSGTGEGERSRPLPRPRPANAPPTPVPEAAPAEYEPSAEFLALRAEVRRKERVRASVRHAAQLAGTLVILGAVLLLGRTLLDGPADGASSSSAAALRSVDLPSVIGSYHRLTSKPARDADAALAARLRRGLQHGEVGSYATTRAGKIAFTMIVYTANTADDLGADLVAHEGSQILDGYLRGFRVDNATEFATGRHGDTARCGARRGKHGPALVCGWADDTTFGALMWPKAVRLQSAVHLTQQARRAAEH